MVAKWPIADRAKDIQDAKAKQDLADQQNALRIKAAQAKLERKLSKG